MNYEITLIVKAKLDSDEDAEFFAKNLKIKVASAFEYQKYVDGEVKDPKIVYSILKYKSAK